jgi:hypothetical protein
LNVCGPSISGVQRPKASGVRLGRRFGLLYIDVVASRQGASPLFSADVLSGRCAVQCHGIPENLVVNQFVHCASLHNVSWLAVVVDLLWPAPADE